jgi:thiaminase
MLIEEIKELLSQSNNIFCQTLGEGSNCANFLAKLEASLDSVLTTHASSQKVLLIFSGAMQLELSFLENSSYFFFLFRLLLF